MDLESVALHMFKVIIGYFKDGSKNKKDLALYDKLRKNLNKAVEMKDVISGKIGIVMPSCNEDTYIIYRKAINTIYVSTCNNYEWELDGESFENNDVALIKKESFYYDIRNEIIHSAEIYEEGGDYDNEEGVCDCSRYYGCHVVTKNQIKLCAECFKELGPSLGKKLADHKKKFVNPISSLDLEDS
jgi:pyridoxal/pyridoxine/pyridoxamine kinase